MDMITLAAMQHGNDLAMRDVYREVKRLRDEIDKANRAYDELEETHRNYVAHARAQVHYHRAAMKARVKINVLMCDEIAKHDPASPFAAMEGVQKMIDQQFEKSIRDPRVVGMTYAQNEVRDIEKHIERYYVQTGDENNPDLVMRQRVA